MIIVDILGRPQIILFNKTRGIQHYKRMITDMYFLVQRSEMGHESMTCLASDMRLDVQPGQAVISVESVVEWNNTHPTSSLPGTKYDGMRRSSRKMSRNLL